MLPLRARVMALFGNIEEKHHQCTIENIFNSASFFKAVYNREKITALWCYKERNDRNPAMSYTRGIKVREGTY